MILGRISDAYRYTRLHPLFDRLFKFVSENDLSKFSNQRIVLDGDDLFINMAEPTLRKAEEQSMEVHRKYIDVHFLLTGEEICGVTHISELPEGYDTEFNEEDDFVLVQQSAKNYFKAGPGDFYIVFPEDAHAPIIGEGTIKKAIAKVKLDWRYDAPF